MSDFNLSADDIPIVDGFDFPVGPRNRQANVFDTYKVDATLADPNYFKLFNAWHTGEDWNGRGGGDSDLGDPVYAIADGKVVDLGYYVPSWGNLVLLAHTLPSGETVWSQYAHLDRILVTQKGQLVKRGDQIGTIGKGEKTLTKPNGRWIAHLHFEIRRQAIAINNWQPMVRNRSEVLAHYHNPTAFINAHRSLRRAAETTPTTIIVDSTNTHRETGSFRKARVDHWYAAPYGYQGDMLWTYSAFDTEANWAEWRAVLPAAGRWEVAAFIPERHATTKQARYTIVHNQGRTHVEVDHSIYSNEWVVLGTFEFTPGTGYIRLTDVTGERRRGLMIAFDAIRWQK